MTGRKSDYYINDLNFTKKDYINKSIDDNLQIYSDYITSYDRSTQSSAPPKIYSAPPTASLHRTSTLEIAYTQPTTAEMQRILNAMHLLDRIPVDQKAQFTEAVREVRYTIDGQIRGIVGGTQHFNSIRALNDPARSFVHVNGGLSPIQWSALPTNPTQFENGNYAQLAGEEYFGINRFLPNFPDVADVQWWAAYKGGTWQLEDWNSNGEHLDTGYNGWGNLVGAVLKVNGRVLKPNEILGFYRTMKLREERGFMTKEEHEKMKAFLVSLSRDYLGVKGILGGRKGYEGMERRALDLGLLNEDGEVTYVGASM